MSTVLSSLSWKRLAAGMAVLFVCAGLMAQATNPAYIGLMPSVDQVKSAIQGADPAQLR